MRTPDVAVVGGGIIGSSIAWRLAQGGAAVTVYDVPAPGRPSTVAAGLLAPATEAEYGATALSRLSHDSAALWPGFADELGGDVGYRRCGTLTVGVDAADVAELDRAHAYRRQCGWPGTRLDTRGCLALEPALSHRVQGGVFAPDDHQVDPRRVMAALGEATAAAGVVRREERVTDPAGLPAGRVVVAAGTWSGRLTGLPVRPIQGQVIRLRGTGNPPVAIRALNRGRAVYVVSRADGEVVVGASSRETGFTPVAAAADTATLLRDAVEVLPELGEYHVAEVNVGLRPGTPDNAPLLGALDDRLVAATGHYRNGVLLAPVTAALISRLILTGRTPEDVAPFDPARFGAR
ncbi:glycine oxidase [Stackebrandtia albiflava]|uniref:glycine oxidase n=1 Tax=Stackebrandtia albiflava TaxID=406432 RepID=A0A562V3M1_9ACTN|nr:glycine oxidase ThiO [Stackebrandtia albiflava]TWJ12422.1 glycine oxidase [Stackebrandtia albiflava]